MSRGTAAAGLEAGGPLRRSPRFYLRELAGGLGDSGLLIPLAIAMIALNGLNATAVFCVTGAVYVATALYFRVPVPVQPLKAFAAAAIALGLEPATLAAGGLLMAAAMAVLALTGLAGWLAARFPLVLVRGIQASVALLLAKAAIELAARGNWDGLAPIAPWVGIATMAAGLGVLLVLGSSARLPGALVVLGAGAAIGLAVGGVPDGLALGPAAVELSLPAGGEFATALTALVIAQLPLTFGNSIVAAADAERTYFGERASRVTHNRLAASIASANALAGVTGAMPLCHGAGGVTAHVKLGARTAVSTMIAGGLFLALGLGLGSSLPVLLTVLAPGALAGMLAFVALQHGLLALELPGLGDRAIAVTTGAATLAAGNLAIGFAVGLALYVARTLARRSRAPVGLAEGKEARV